MAAACRPGARGAAAGAGRACAAAGRRAPPARHGLGSRPPGRPDRCAAACSLRPGLPGRRAEAPARPRGKGFATSPHRPPGSWAPVAPTPDSGHDSRGWARAKGVVSRGRCGGGTIVRPLGRSLRKDGASAAGPGPGAWGRGAPRRPGPGRTRAAAAAGRVLSLAGPVVAQARAYPVGSDAGGSLGSRHQNSRRPFPWGRLGACYQQSPPSLDCLGESGANQSLGLGSSPVWVF